MAFYATPGINSKSAVAEDYYHMLKHAYKKEVRRKKSDEEFDGTLSDDILKNKTKFTEQTYIPQCSQALIEYLILLEWKVQNKVPLVTPTAIFNAILRLEHVLRQASLWELVLDTDEGLLPDLSTFEVNMIEQNTCLYIANILETECQVTLLFPLKDPLEADILVTLSILEKIGSVTIIPAKTIYQQKLQTCLEKRLKNEAKQWIKDKLKEIKSTNHMPILNEVKNVIMKLKELNEEIRLITADCIIDSVFKAAHSCYFDVLAEVMDVEIWDVCNKTTEFLDDYSELHKEYHVNLKESSILCHALYLQVKKITELFAVHAKNFSSGKLQNFEKAFDKGFIYLLQVTKVETHSRIQRAMELNDKESIIEDEGIWSSIVIVLTCLCVVLDEWKRLEIENEDMQITFLIKTTEVLCDGCKICCEKLLSDILNFPNSTDPKNLKQMSVHINSVHYLIEYISKLPETMKWNNILTKLKGKDNPSETKMQIQRSLNLILNSSINHLKDIKQDMCKIIAENVRKCCDKFLNSWLKDYIIRDPRLQNMHRFLIILDESLEILHTNMKFDNFSNLINALWKNILTYVHSEFQSGRDPDYSKTIRRNIEEIYKYFSSLEVEEESEDTIDLHKRLLNTLEVNSQTTLELQLKYFGQIADYLGPQDNGLGRIAFQIGYKKSKKKIIDIKVKVHRAQKLPIQKCDASSVKIKIEFCPYFLFPSQKSSTTKKVTEDLNNPVFDEEFCFNNIPLTVLSVEGAVVRLLLLNEDKSYCSETFLRLSMIQNMSNLISIDFLPVHLLPLRKPGENSVAFQILKSRKRCDSCARRFITKEIMPKQKYAKVFRHVFPDH